MFFISEISFASYKEYLKFTYNSALASGRIVELVELVKNQPKQLPFDYDFCTVEGKKEIYNASYVCQSQKKTTLCFSLQE